MNEFKFLAFSFSYRILMYIAIPIWAIFIVGTLFFDLHHYIFQYFGIFFVACLIWLSFAFLFIMKRVKIVSISDLIQIYINGNLKYETHISNLKHIISNAPNNTFSRNSISFVFEDKEFTFLIMESKGISLSSSKRFKIINHFVQEYELRKEIHNKEYKYINTCYKKI